MPASPPPNDFGTFSFWEVLQSSLDHSSLDWPTRTAPPAMASSHSPPGAPKVLAPNLPTISYNDSFVKVVKELLHYIVHEISMPASFDQLRTTAAGHKVVILVDHLVHNVTNPALINALITLKWHFSTIEASAINDTRVNACEIVAWRFLSRISERDAAMYCLYELPKQGAEQERGGFDSEVSERSTLLPQFRAQDRLKVSSQPANKRIELLREVANIRVTSPSQFSETEEDEDPLSSFTGMNGLEIAAVAKCKKFLSQKIVQKVINGIWNGDIIFWDNLASTTKKKPQLYNKQKSDIFTRLRVPRYIKTFEIFFVATFLFLYYAVLIDRNPYRITFVEILLYVWFAAFFYNELGEFLDTNSIFYAVDIWNGCDMIIILIGAAFFVTRVVGIYQGNDEIINTAFDILALEALFMVPRIFSILTLHPHFGLLIPCLEEMVKDFLKFLVIVVILYVGFLTTFTLLARDTFNLHEMSWFLVRVFFQGGQLGFEIMRDINPNIGPPLMVVFVCMTQILLITSLICIQRESFQKVMAHAREEYLFGYSVYVLEVSTSKRLTHFYPPLNLIPLVLVRPLRVFLPAEKIRKIRIVLLRATHLPIVGTIWLWEFGHSQVKTHVTFSSTAHHLLGPPTVHGTDPSHPELGSISQQSHAVAKEAAASPHTANDKLNKEAEKTTVVSNPDLDEQVKELTSQVKDLSFKIGELTALIMAQQGTVTPPNDGEEDDEGDS